MCSRHYIAKGEKAVREAGVQNRDNNPKYAEETCFKAITKKGMPRQMSVVNVINFEGYGRKGYGYW
jgi:hypothetical protein